MLLFSPSKLLLVLPILAWWPWCPDCSRIFDKNIFSKDLLKGDSCMKWEINRRERDVQSSFEKLSKKWEKRSASQEFLNREDNSKRRFDFLLQENDGFTVSFMLFQSPWKKNTIRSRETYTHPSLEFQMLRDWLDISRLPCSSYQFKTILDFSSHALPSRLTSLHLQIRKQRTNVLSRSLCQNTNSSLDSKSREDARLLEL